MFIVLDNSNRIIQMASFEVDGSTDIGDIPENIVEHIKSFDVVKYIDGEFMVSNRVPLSYNNFNIEQGRISTMIEEVSVLDDKESIEYEMADDTIQLVTKADLIDVIKHTTGTRRADRIKIKKEKIK